MSAILEAVALDHRNADVVRQPVDHRQSGGAREAGHEKGGVPVVAADEEGLGGVFPTIASSAVSQYLASAVPSGIAIVTSHGSRHRYG